MTVYIDKGAAKRAVDMALELDETEYKKVCAAIDSVAPVTDVLPVVRCGDCKYRTTDTRWTRAGFCGRRGAGDFYVAPFDGFCSYGKRKYDGR